MRSTTGLSGLSRGNSIRIRRHQQRISSVEIRMENGHSSGKDDGSFEHHSQHMDDEPFEDGCHAK